MNKKDMERMMAEMKGDFSHVKDKRRRRALEKLKRSGMQVSGVSNMDIDQLENVSACNHLCAGEKALLRLDRQCFKTRYSFLSV